MLDVIINYVQSLQNQIEVILFEQLCNQIEYEKNNFKMY